MAISVRDTLENLGFTVGYDGKTGGVLVKDSKGNDINIGNNGFNISNDDKYYTDDVSNVYSALAKNNLSVGSGWKPIRNYLSPTEYVGYNDSTKQVSVNGKDYNVDGKNLVAIGNYVYGKEAFLDSMKSAKDTGRHEDSEQKILEALIDSDYSGWVPENDISYQNALNDYIKTSKADMGNRGIISDSLASHYASQGAAKLAPEFAEADYKKYADDRKAKLDLLDEINSLHETDISEFKAKADDSNQKNEFALSSEEAESKIQLDKIKTAIERTKLSGYVTEQDAALLGLEAGQLTDDAKKRIQEREWQLEDRNMDMEDYEKKAEIDFSYWQREFGLTSEQAEEAMKIKSELNISEAMAAAYYKFLYK